MSSYTFRKSPDFVNQILDRRIMEFLEALEKGNAYDKLELKAEKVRIAKINLLKTKLSLYQSNHSDPRYINAIKFKDKLHQDFLKWGNISFEEIIEYCESMGYV